MDAGICELLRNSLFQISASLALVESSTGPICQLIKVTLLEFGSRILHDRKEIEVGESVVRNHDYAKFLSGGKINDSRMEDTFIWDV